MNHLSSHLLSVESRLARVLLRNALLLAALATVVTLCLGLRPAAKPASPLPWPWPLPVHAIATAALYLTAHTLHLRRQPGPRPDPLIFLDPLLFPLSFGSLSTVVLLVWTRDPTRASIYGAAFTTLAFFLGVLCLGALRCLHRDPEHFEDIAHDVLVATHEKALWGLPAFALTVWLLLNLHLLPALVCACLGCLAAMTRALRHTRHQIGCFPFLNTSEPRPDRKRPQP